MAEASLFVLDLAPEVYQAQTQPMLSHINVGSGTDVTIADLARMIATVVGYTGRLSFDASKPDGTMRKLMDVSRLDRLGWRARISLQDGIASTYEWYLTQLRNQTSVRGADLVTSGKT
ncbi:MAG: GDP-L-fucose synthase, partial [Candidatus Saccharibacteria bacterium]|nr:GDP-L-fucose synthase [Pseudorhodobacter sp.]